MINKDLILKSVLDKDRVLVSSILDKYIKYDKTGINTYSNFLDERELKVVTDFLKRNNITYNIYRKIDECEKSIIYFGEYDNFVTTYKIKNTDFKHKDILGTLFSLGYDNSSIGDIFISNDYVYFTNLTRLNPVIENQFNMIKNTYIDIEKTDEIILDRDRFIDIKIVVPSYRFDVIVGKLSNLSRNDSTKYIKDGMVLINYEEVNNPSKTISIGDIISIRRVGKFKIDSELLISKKGNYLLNIKKYN